MKSPILSLSNFFLSFVLLTVTPFLPAQEEKTVEATHSDIPYGIHAPNVLDFWQANGEGPRPLLVYIHGGGWTSGDKAKGLPDIEFYREKGISVAAINYRHTPDNPLPAPVHDAVRAIQFLKSKSEEWSIDKDRIALTGGSAGACTSMWILCHDDMANPASKDPVERESSRVAGAAVSGGQTSIDPKQIEPWLGPKVLEHRMINMAVGERTIDGALQKYNQYEGTYEEFSAYNHVTADDPPLLMTYGSDMTLPSKNAGHGIHHPVYGVKMKEKADAVGIPCYLIIPGHSEEGKYKTREGFLLDVLLR